MQVLLVYFPFSLIIFYNILGKLKWNLNYKSRLLLTFLYGFSSIHWSISSNILWQHTFIEFLNLAVVLLYINYKKYNNLYQLIFIGIIHGILFYIRPTTIFIIMVYYAFFLHFEVIDLKEKNQNNFKFVIQNLLNRFLLLSGSSFIIIIPMAILNFRIYGNPIGGYLNVLLDPHRNDVGFSINQYFFNLLGIFFSPNYGLFAFHPFLLFVYLIGFIYIWKINKNNQFKFNNPIESFIILYSLSSVLVYILFYSSNTQWTGFYNFGPRMLMDVMPFFILLFIFIILKVKHYFNLTQKIVFGLLLLFSFIIQLYGNSSQNLLGDWYCDVHYKKDLHLDIQRKIWDFQDPLFFHKIYYRNQPIFKDITIYNGSKLCSEMKIDSENSQWLLFSKSYNERLKKMRPNFYNENESKYIKLYGDLLAYYYFFIDKSNYLIQIHLKSKIDKIQNLKILLKQNEAIKPYSSKIHKGENSICINLRGEKNKDRIYIYFFVKDLEEMKLQEIVIKRNANCN